MTSSRDKIIADIERVRDTNNLLIHPGRDIPTWADLVIQHNGCPCVPGRPVCPCDQVMADIAELGRCRCGLFCNKRYLAEYNRLRGNRKSGHRR